jgi:small-conductance mechanosensitive channel
MWTQCYAAVRTFVAARSEGLATLAALLAAVLGGLVLHAAAIRVARLIVRQAGWKIDESFFTRLKRPSRLLFPVLAVQFVMPALTGLSPAQHDFLQHVLSLGMIAAGAYFLIALACGVEEHIKRQTPVDVADNYYARRLHTQLTVLRRTLATFIVVVAVAVGLMTYSPARQFGASLLASAGVAGLVIGLAARPTLENLIAGVQIALTQPIKIDDVVIVDGEWGRIEEISTTYVVVRIWDERRLIVPFARFIQESFQNWTRRSAQILGTVFLYADYTVPVQAVREELERIVQTCEKWDGRVCVLQVTDATQETVELRALVSAAGSGEAWDLRVFVREKLVEFLQREYPDCLPRRRVELPERREKP